MSLPSHSGLYSNDTFYECVLLISEFRYYINATMSLYSNDTFYGPLAVGLISEELMVYSTMVIQW